MPIEPELKNAIITRVSLSNADHGSLSAWLTLDYGGSGQGFGGYSLYSEHKSSKCANYAGHFIWRCLEIGGVTKWNSLVGKTIRVRATHSGITAIGHIVKDIWFDPTSEFRNLEESLGK